MQKNVEVAERLGYLDIPDGLLVSLNEAKMMSDYEIVFRLPDRKVNRARRSADGEQELQHDGRGRHTVVCRRIIPGNERRSRG